MCYFGLISSAKQKIYGYKTHALPGRNTYIILVCQRCSSGTPAEYSPNLHIVISAWTSRYDVSGWLNVVQWVHVSDRSNNAHCLKKKNYSIRDTVPYIAVQLSITPESHFREDRHTTKDKKTVLTPL